MTIEHNRNNLLGYDTSTVQMFTDPLATVPFSVVFVNSHANSSIERGQTCRSHSSLYLTTSDQVPFCEHVVYLSYNYSGNGIVIVLIVLQCCVCD